MNFLSAQHRGGRLQLAGHALAASRQLNLPDGPLQVGVRPEYLALTAPDAPGALPCSVVRVQDIGTYFLLTAEVDGQVLRARLAPETMVPSVGETVWLRVLGEHTCFYQNEELLA